VAEQSMLVPMSAGLRLLLLASRVGSEKVDGTDLAEAVDAVHDWPAFLALVDRHRLAPQVYHALKNCSADCMDPVQVQALRTRMKMNTRKALLQITEWVRIRRHFSEKGIACLVFKGPVLAVQAYGELALRHAGDLDVVVAPDVVLVAEKILLSLGYIRAYSSGALSSRQWQAYRGRFADLGYVHRRSGLRLELHWRFFHNPQLLPLDSRQVLAESRMLRVAGVPTAAMSLPDLLLVLCVHGAKHGWFRLFWLADINALLATFPCVEQRKLLKRAQALGVERMFLQGLMLAHRLYRSPLDAEVLAEAEQAGEVGYLVGVALDAMAAPEAQWGERGGRSLRAALNRLVYLGRLRGGWHYRWREFADSWIHPEDWQRVPLPDALFFLYWPLRPLLRWWRPGRSRP